MKLLIYGIDGGDLAVMQKFPMPFLRSFLEENTSIELTSDLINRGWAEILTGKRGHETGAFYMAPLLDGTHRCSTSFSMAKLAGRSDIKPMWELFEENDLPYLIMNVPTTTPAPKVEKGYVIGSAGGGLNKINGIPESLVSNPNLIPVLESHNYIVDIRIPNPDYEKTVDMLDDLVLMEERRTESFIDICKSRALEAGFLCNRGTTIVEYLARSDIESYEAYKTMEEFMPRHQEKSWIHKKLEEHFAMVDRQLERLYSELEPEHFIITADHGNCPHRYRANVTPFLEQTSYFIPKQSLPLINWLRKIKNRTVIKGVSDSVMKKVPTARDVFSNCNWRRTRAFGSTYIPGIFINDQRRFGGPVREEAINNLVDEIVDKFNKLEFSERIGMEAKPYRRLLSGQESDKLPDIKLHNSEGVFFDDSVKSLNFKNPFYGPVPKDLSLVKHAPFTGDKGQKPICVLSQKSAQLVEDCDVKDLTLVYRLTERIVT